MLYFYYGDNIYTLEEKLRIFRARYEQKFSSGLNFWKFDFAESTPGDFRRAIEAHSMFGEKKLIFTEGLGSLSADAWTDITESIARSDVEKTSDVVVVFFERSPASSLKKLKQWTYLLKNSNCEEFKTPTGMRLVRWVESEVKKRESSIVPSAAALLAEYVGPDTMRLAKEIEKLCLYQNGGTIGDRDVRALVYRSPDSNVFATIDALARKDKSVALQCLHMHREFGDDPLQILGMFAYQMRTLLLVREAAEKEKDPSRIASHLKLHPFVVRKALVSSRTFTRSELMKIHRLLAEADFAGKTGGEPFEALETFVYRALEA